MAEHSDFIDALTQMIGGELEQVNTAIPCTIIDYSSGRVSVRPSGLRKYQDGDSNAFPIIHNLRVCWPEFSAGKAGIKGVMSSGDNALLIVCQQAIDDPEDFRKFDLVDSYVMPGGGGSDEYAGNDDLRMYFGNAFIAINGDGKITINAPGGFEEIAPSHKSNADHDLASAKISGIDFASHKHTGVATGNSTTGEPIA